MLGQRHRRSWSELLGFGGRRRAAAIPRRRLAIEGLEDRRMLAAWPVQAGGTGSSEGGNAISALANGAAIVTGGFSGTATFGSTTLTSSGDRDAFVAKVNADGTFAWALKAGGTDDDSGLGISASADGSAIITGSFGGTATFGATTLTSSGDKDAFVVKVNADGTFAWALKVGGLDRDYGSGISALADGSAILTGGFVGRATFGATTLTSSGDRDAFVAKVNATGTFAWAVNAGGTGVDRGLGISALADGSALVTGSFEGTATFGSTTLTSSGFFDVFVAKTNATGTFAWAVKAGGTDYDKGLRISALANGSAIVTGEFTGTATFGSTTLTSSGDGDAFVAKVNATGAFAWAVRAGGATFDSGSDISALADGSALVTGQFTGTATFGATVLTSSGGSDDAFVAKVNATGAFVWAVKAGGSGQDYGYGVSTLADGSALVTGRFRFTATFGATALTSSGGSDDVFVAKVNPGGLFAQASSRAVDAVDLNGDGIVDAIWESAGGPSVGWIYDAAGGVVQTRVLGSDATWSIETVGDFDGNRVTDLVWRNATTGAEVLWLMQASGAALSTTVLGGNATWRIESSGDYDGDGRTDLVWRNAVTGANVMRLMNGGSVSAKVPIGGDLSWRLVATAADYDSNGDGRTDLVWRNAAGLTSLWRMSGGVVLSTQFLGGDAGWQIVGTGDFNGDDTHDLLWRSGSGTVVQWLMKDGVVLLTTTLAVGSERAPVGTADINGDAKTDILWRNASTGATTVWLMNGSSVAATRDIGGNAVWRILRRPGRRPV